VQFAFVIFDKNVKRRCSVVIEAFIAAKTEMQLYYATTFFNAEMSAIYASVLIA